MSDPRSRADYGAPTQRDRDDLHGDIGQQDVDRLLGMLARTDIDPGDRLSQALASLSRWADDAPRAAEPRSAEPQLRPSVQAQPQAQPQHSVRDELESQLEDFARSLTNGPQAAAARPTSIRQEATRAVAAPKLVQPATPPVASLRAALAEIALRQKALDEEEARANSLEPVHAAAPSAPRHEETRYEAPRYEAPQAANPEVMREMRSELDTLGRSVETLPTRGEIDRLTQEMTTLATRLGADTPARLDADSLRAIDALVVEVDRMRSDAASPQIISDLSEELRAISARLDVIGPRNVTAIDALTRRIDDVKAELDQFPRIAAVDGVTTEIKAIMARLDAQEKAAAPTREAVIGLSGRVQALDGRIVEMANAATARDASIRAELTNLPRADAMSSLGRQIDALTDGLKNRSAIGPALQAVEGLAGKVDALDGKFAAVKPDAFDKLGRQLETLTGSLKAFRPEQNSGAVDALSGKLDSLGQHMQAMTAATQSRGAAFERIEESVRTVAEQLLTSRTPSAAGAALETEASRLLDRLQAGDSRMDDLHAAFAGLASRIERSCTDLGQNVVKNAVSAARETLGGEGGNGVESEISKALAEMRASSAQSERRAADTLDAVRSTLDKLLDRMENLGSSAGAIAAHQAASGPDAFTLRSEPLRQEPARHEAPRREAPRAEPRRRVADIAPTDAEAALAAAERAMTGDAAPAIRAPQPAIEPALEPDMPLEPGLKPAALGGQQTAASLIAAARRANSQPAAEPAIALTDKDLSDKPSFMAGALASLKARRRPLLLGIAATLIVFAALYVASGMTSAPPAEPEAAPPAPQSSLAPSYEPKLAQGFTAEKPKLERRPTEMALAEDRDGVRSVETEDLPPERAMKNPIGSEYADVDGPAEPEAAKGAGPRVPARDLTNFAFTDGAKPGSTEWQVGEPVTTGSIGRTSAGELPEAIGGQLLRTRAASGDAAAQLEVADRLLEGRRVDADPAGAIKWLEKAAAQGLAPAQQRLGSLYEKGRGVTRDIPAARRWYEQSAASGNVRSMHNLGVIHAEGGLGKPDYNAAVVWFRMAADRGLVDSQYNLAVLCARGLGGKRDLVEAYKWFALAAQQGDKDAGLKRDEVGKALGSTVSVAKAAVASFRARTVDSAANEAIAPAGGWDRVAERRDDKTLTR